MKHKLNTLLAATTFIAVGLACGNSKSEQSAATPAASESTPAITISSEKLVADYKENEVAADSKYTGKKLEVSGKVGNIANTMGNITVSLKAKDFEFVSVMCSFEKAESVAALKAGQKVTFVGIGDGMTGGLYVGLKDCAVK